jgi:hypothetical protein
VEGAATLDQVGLDVDDGSHCKDTSGLGLDLDSG